MSPSVETHLPDPGAPPSEPLPAPPPMRKSAAGFYLALMFAYVAFGSLAQAASPVLGLAWSELFAVGLPALVAASGSNLDVRRWLLLSRRPTPVQVALGAAIGASGLVLATGLVALTLQLVPQEWGHDLVRLFDRPALEALALGLVAATLAPLCEEVAFRGYLLSALRTRGGETRAVAISALLFAAMHLDPVRFPALAVLGALYAWLAVRSGSLWPSVAAHAANNAIGALLLGGGVRERGGPEEAPGVSGGLALLAVGIAMLLPLGRAFQRATPSPPTPRDNEVPRCPGSPSVFEPWRVDPVLRRAVLAGLGLLGLLGLLAALRGR